MIKIIFFLFLIISIPIAGFLWYMGFFDTLAIGVDKSGHYWLVYEKIKGDYRQAGDSCGKVSRWLYANNIPASKEFGMYFDNPQKVPKNELRSIAGALIDDKDSDKIEQIKQEFYIQEIFPLSCIKTSFPYKNQLSLILGIFRAYPEIAKYAEINNYTQNYEASIEIYDEKAGQITYFTPIEQNLNLVDKYYNTEK
ncbi:MAG: hypothetical protein LHV68_12760 [Elusimicrobia bacterium]|nr:hypothetical protein [Candidatus Liberimonas magnetica]